VGRLLNKEHNVTIYEQNSTIGGIAKTKEIDGVAYHMIGGHCVNSKNKDVLEFIFDTLPKKDWHLVERNAQIHLEGNYIPYPIEFSIKEISKFNEDLAYDITKDYLSSKGEHDEDLDSWFRGKFGNTLAEKYFIPYNKKIWNMDPAKMSHAWVEGKLPAPNKKEFFKALMGNGKDNMPHSAFYYPNTNNQNTFIEAISQDLNIVTNYKVKSIEKNKTGWVINNKETYDLVINTMPLNILPHIVKDTPERIKNDAKKLKYNKVSTMLWSTNPIKATWSYYPSNDTIFHRHIHIGNFFSPRQNYTITECVGEYTYKDMVEHGGRFDYLKDPLDYNISDHAYVVYDHNYRNATKNIKNYLSSIGLYTIGRFGEWEYYNMDICIESAMKLRDEINLM